MIVNIIFASEDNMQANFLQNNDFIRKFFFHLPSKLGTVFLHQSSWFILCQNLKFLLTMTSNLPFYHQCFLSPTASNWRSAWVPPVKDVRRQRKVIADLGSWGETLHIGLYASKISQTIHVYHSINNQVHTTFVYPVE